MGEPAPTQSQADSYLEQWQTLATARDGSHLKLTVGFICGINGLCGY